MENPTDVTELRRHFDLYKADVDLPLSEFVYRMLDEMMVLLERYEDKIKELEE